VEVAAYRIATEAVTNALRHADASSCRVHVGWEAGWLAVEVSDDGRGMQSDGRGGVGMTSMEERAQEVGGRLEVTSSGQGTTVRALLPVTTA
jgi:signal transduction histidine kinase